MPPLRTFTPVKAVKTERTHEENQERAYIAASRRSDRSLEARVESARRASEIHKRRTGRSLRVTEQDVINEEMYEEEDDDLPSQYRRLTAHLQTGSADFNRRLAAYLTSNVAMRSALDQAITSSYAQQFPNAPRFAHNNPVPFPSPLSTQGLGTMNPSASQNSPQSPHPYRQSPYPMAGMAGYRQHSQHRRTHSMSTDDSKTQNITTSADKQASMLESVLAPTKATESSSMSPPRPKDAPPSPLSRGVGSKPSHEHTASSYSQSISPLTTTLPTESQMLLGSALDTTNPFNFMLMGGNDQSNYFDHDFFGSSNKESNFYPNLDGMNTTLAPSANLSMQASFDALDSNGRQSGGPFDNALSFDHLKGHDFVTSDSGSGNASPGIDGTWETFIDDSSSWAENAT